MVRPRGPRGGQTWRTFVKNHASQMFAVDFLTQHTAFFTAVYIFVVLEIATRRIVLINATTSPGLAWVTSADPTGDGVGPEPTFRVARQRRRFRPVSRPQAARGIAAALPWISTEEN